MSLTTTITRSKPFYVAAGATDLAVKTLRTAPSRIPSVKIKVERRDLEKAVATVGQQTVTLPARAQTTAVGVAGEVAGRPTPSTASCWSAAARSSAGSAARSPPRTCSRQPTTTVRRTKATRRPRPKKSRRRDRHHRQEGRQAHRHHGARSGPTDHPHAPPRAPPPSARKTTKSRSRKATKAGAAQGRQLTRTQHRSHARPRPARPRRAGPVVVPATHIAGPCGFAPRRGPLVSAVAWTSSAASRAVVAAPARDRLAARSRASRSSTRCAARAAVPARRAAQPSTCLAGHPRRRVPDQHRVVRLTARPWACST